VNSTAAAAVCGLWRYTSVICLCLCLSVIIIIVVVVFCGLDAARAEMCTQLNVVQLLLTLLNDPGVKCADRLQLLLTLNRCLDGNGIHIQHSIHPLSYYSVELVRVIS